ncbi:MAG: MFS transporter, partial [Proteobacteria bacterium]|nr:MFS transporter [Pseudomonadota bacterium]
MIEKNLAMYEITVGESTDYRIPYFQYRGTPTGIDVFKVVDTGIAPVIDAGLAVEDVVAVLTFQGIITGAAVEIIIARLTPQRVVTAVAEYYVVDTGATGVAATLFVIGVIYLLVMLAAAFSYRLPAPGWKPAAWEEPPDDARHRLISKHDVDIDQALKTPQFYQLWIVLCFNVTAGIGVLGVAKTMITEIFGTTLPGMVDAAYAATYVVMISFFNMVGRFIWASSSDYIGRRNTYWIFFVLGIFLYLSVPFTAQQVSVNPAVIWLVYFYAATMIIFTMYGGGFATIPAYLADIF